jgi:hypothetical protein
MREGRGSIKKTRNDGFLHVLKESVADAERRVKRVQWAIELPAPPGDLGPMAEACRQKLSPSRLSELAATLGLTETALAAFGVGWSELYGGCFSFPMQCNNGQVVGIRLRKPDGTKLAVKGGREGLFVPTTFCPDGTLVIAEGPTDAAAMLDLGFNAIGRPSCTGGTKYISRIIQAGDFKSVVIAADADTPGQRGAIDLAIQIAADIESVKIVTPPAIVKDVRAWKRAGATPDDVLAVIDAAPAFSLAIGGAA